MYKGQSAACLFPHSNSHLPSHLLARRHGTRWGGMPGVSPASTPQAQMVPKTQQAYSSLQPYTLCPNHNTPQIQSGPIYFYKPTNRVGLKSKYSWLLAQLYEQLFTPQTVHEVALTGAWDAWGHGACGVCSQAAGAQAQITYLSSAPKFIPDSWDWQCCCCPKRTRDRQTRRAKSILVPFNSQDTLQRDWTCFPFSGSKPFRGAAGIQKAVWFFQQLHMQQHISTKKRFFPRSWKTIPK